MSKKFVKSIRDSEECLTKIRAELPPELQKVIDFLFNAANSNVDDNFFNKIFSLEDLEVKKSQWFNGKCYIETENGHYRGNNGKFIHRVIWEYFNSEIPKGYVVHHIDFNPANNDISNLTLLTYSEHRKLHFKRDRYKKYVCEYCGKEFESKCNFKGVCRFCSSECKTRWHYRNTHEVRICAECGNEFETYKYGTVRHCSKKCANKARSRTQKK